MRRSPTRVPAAALLIVAFASGGFSAGCGGAELATKAADAPASSAAAAEATATPEAALAAFAEAERKIDGLFPPAGSPAPTAAPAPPPPPPLANHGVAEKAPSPTTPARSPAAGRDKREERAAPSDSKPEAPGQPIAADSCSSACSALGSLERAAEHVCALTSAADPRCTGARARTASAAARVRAACPSCGGP